MSRTILSIDPGTERSGYVMVREWSPFPEILASDGSMRNDDVLHRIKAYPNIGTVCCETMSAQDARVGAETFATCYFIGRMQQQCIISGHLFWPLERRDLKRRILGTYSGKDSLIRKEIIKRFSYGETDEKKAKSMAIGTAKRPGPLFGVSDHSWQALGVALCYLQELETKEIAK